MRTSTPKTLLMASIPTIFNYFNHRNLPKSLVGLLLFFTFLVPNLSSGQSINQLYQWANTDYEWQTGNLGTSNSIYQEDDTVPYFTNLSGLTVDQVYTIEIEWDTSKSSKHALDYLTTYDRTYDPINPAVEDGLVPDTVPDDTEPIPQDTFMQSDINWNGTQESGVFTIWNGTFVDDTGSASGDATSDYTTPTDYLGDTSTSIQITFKATATDVVIAWGGHIGSQGDWGAGNSAGTISGSPFHMRINQWFIPANTCPTSTIKDFTQLNVGQLDRSLSAAAVIIPGTISIFKDAQPN
ncbi:MAG: hypothetical protein HKO94_05685, partial [Flavobacteriaceae bacterium]|nr:hypothetical protein [Flavobacteriaceae bacterium]